MADQKRIYFPNLNGIRFIAAFMVLYDHVKHFKWLYKIDNWQFPIKTSVGDLGVTLFFVLSGFLITYLLLEEQKEFGKIQLRFFYMRRVLRIFPLYYLIVILAFFLLPHFISIPGFVREDAIYHSDKATELLPDQDPYFYKKFALFLLFLPNLCYVIHDLVPFASQLWSVGVEEQFYLFWPTLLILFKKRILVVFIIVLFSITCLILFLNNLPHKASLAAEFSVLNSFLAYFRIDAMAMGGIMAYFLFKKKIRFLTILYSWEVQLIILSSIIILIAFNLEFGNWTQLVYAMFFSLLILNLASNPKSIVNLEHPILSYLGKISYGLYVYNPLAIILSIHISLFIFKGESIGFNIVLFACSVILTIAISALSYRFFEAKFLNLKKGFSKVLSNRY